MVVAAGAAVAATSGPARGATEKNVHPARGGNHAPDASTRRLAEPYAPDRQFALYDPYGYGGMQYNGGPVMANPINVYLIWYGKWDGNNATAILPQFLQDLSQSPWARIQTTYLDASGAHASDVINYAGSVFVGYPRGLFLNDSDISAVRACAAVDVGQNATGVCTGCACLAIPRGVQLPWAHRAGTATECRLV